MSQTSKTLASEVFLMAVASTASSDNLKGLVLTQALAQLVQRIGCTWVQPFLAQLLFPLFLVVMEERVPESQFYHYHLPSFYRPNSIGGVPSHPVEIYT